MTDTANSPFSQGSRWVRADFHLHTKADKEFTYSDGENDFVARYVDALSGKDIRIGVITNHNKFGAGEFKALRKAAGKKGIYLMPGVELSVNDGANGVHTLIVFSEHWLENGQDYINQFLNVAFAGKTPGQYENENGRCSLGLIDTIRKLEEYHRDFFLVFAHVEDSSGLWNALDGGRVEELGRDEHFRRRALGFQKVRTHDVPDRKCRVKVQGWLGDAYPAEVEGSDPKAMDQIGKGEDCWLKLGDFNFEAVKYTLLDHKNRIANQVEEHEHSHIVSMSFEGGVLDGETIALSPELNALIGIRGSGKSSILETLRYALDIPFGIKALDTEYKRDLVDHVLGSGGKITIRAIDRHGQPYEIRRINKESADVFIDGIIQPGVSIKETIIRKPIYFGQKDLSSTGEGFEKDLVEKLVGEKLAGIRSNIASKKQNVVERVNRLKQLSNAEERKTEITAKKKDIEYRLKFYQDHGVEKKLQKQVDFDADNRKCERTVSFVKSYLGDLEALVNRYEDDLKNQRVYTSKQNKAFFEKFFNVYDKVVASFNEIQGALSFGQKTFAQLGDMADEFRKTRDGLKEEFAEIGRKLSEQLKESGVREIKPDEFRELRKDLDNATETLKALDKDDILRNEINRELLQELTALNDLWHEEFKAIQTEVEKVNKAHSSLEIKVEFKRDKSAFKEFIKNVFRGSRIRDTCYDQLIGAYSDFGAIFKGLEEARSSIGTSGQVFEEYFNENLSSLLTWQVPNRFVIEYRGKELKHHSLGQRASALILFVLSQRENDVFIIDQPEDDLDNQTIYEDVIKLVRELKPATQFIFATHNANFPVLGDAEQVVACSYFDDAIHPEIGSIDCPDTQQKIVDIMEGGDEAFQQRQRRYEIWKPKNS